MRGRKSAVSVLLLLSLSGAIISCGQESGTGAAVDSSASSPEKGRPTPGAPSAKVLELHRLRLPNGATDVFSHVDDGWSSYGLWLTFRLPKAEMEDFLARIGVPKSRMRQGFYIQEADEVGWKPEPGRTYLKGSSDGTDTPDSAPGYRVSLDVTDTSEFTVYLCSFVVPA